jgi:hypothetical protein
MRAAKARLHLVLLVYAPVLAAEAGNAPAVALDGLVSHAEVTGPRGSFVTEMVSLADGTTRFVQIYPPSDPRNRGRIEYLVSGGDLAFQRNAKREFEPAAAGTSSFVLGHDAVRLALNKGGPKKLSLPAPAEMSGGVVTIDLSDYRKVIGYDLPFSATFVHSAAPNDRFSYRFTVLLPFRVAPGSPSPGNEADPAGTFARLGDLAEIAIAHERVMAAHRASNAELLTSDAAGSSTVSGRGRLTEVKRDDQLARMREYLSAIRFSRYADTAVPVVALSEDGTLAWLACEMEAEGIRAAHEKSEPIAYAFSWVEMYARGAEVTGDRRPWRSIGNASSQRP